MVILIDCLFVSSTTLQSAYVELLGINLINIGKTWEKLILAARIIASIENVSNLGFFYMFILRERVN